MRAIDVGIRHDDHALVAQFIDIKCAARSAAKREGNVRNFLVRADLVCGRAGDIQYLSSERENGLCLADACLLGGAPSRIALDQEDFRIFSAVARTIREFPWKP